MLCPVAAPASLYPMTEVCPTTEHKVCIATWGRCLRMLVGFLGVLLLALGLPSVPGRRGYRRMGSRLASLPPKRWRRGRSCGRLCLNSRAAARLLPECSSRYSGRGCLSLACRAAALLLPECRSRCRQCGRARLARRAAAWVLCKCHSWRSRCGCLCLACQGAAETLPKRGSWRSRRGCLALVRQAAQRVACISQSRSMFMTESSV